jgi:nitroimidazol reductase NimA-like FMN-containing flavoprotein (pyridoxamine 5'-phosphate oxidase superfamily)
MTDIATAVRRHPERSAYDRATIDAILDEGFVGHAGLVAAGQPYVLPMLYARDRDQLYLHGAPASRLLGTFAERARVCFTVTLVDGLVLARSAFRHSVNYRSVVVLGEGRPVTDATEKLGALEAIVDHVLAGRSSEIRGPSRAELKATEVVALDLARASAKVRTGPPIDNPRDYRLDTWAGEVPLALRAGEPIPDPSCALPTPPSIRAYSRVHE